MSSAWFLYVLECRDGSLYTGITVNVGKRFAAHMAGKGARYTRARKPERVLAVRPFPDRSSASRAEYALKQLTVEQKRAFCLQYPYLQHPSGEMGGDGIEAREPV